MSRPSIVPHLLVAAGVLTLAGLSAWQSAAIPRSPLQSAVGPDVAGWFVSAFLLVMGLGLLVTALAGGWARDQDGTLTEWGSLGLVALGLFANVTLIDVVGFILASTVMFALVARGFGSTGAVRDIGIGFTVAVVSYIGFDRLLGYKIGSGLIERFI